MTPMTRFSSTFFFILPLLILSGCSSTQLIQSWSEPDFQGQPLKRILIIGIMRSDQQRRIYEDAFVARLKADGVSGVAGYTLIDDSKDYKDGAIIRDAVRKSAADGALIGTLISVDKQERIVPPSVYYEPMYGYRHGFYDYYGMSHRAVYSPGYTTIDTVVKLETTVFSLSPEKMIWAGTTESFNPSSPLKIMEENADIIIENMRTAKLL